MTRMIDEQRTALGAYKALGYSGPAIAFKYVSYAAIASLLGGLVGGLVGIRVLPKVIFDSWAMMYELPEMQQVNHVALIVGSALLATALMTVTAYLAVRNELRAVPATLMRPKAPAAGKVIPVGADRTVVEQAELQPEGDDAQHLPLQEALLHDRAGRCRVHCAACGRPWVE